MGYQIYCAICGGPHRKVEISREPRSEAFKAALARGELRDARDYKYGERPPCASAELTSYDPEIITEKEAKWTDNVAVLGFNPLAKGHDP
jgi:hypothetical protein